MSIFRGLVLSVFVSLQMGCLFDDVPLKKETKGRGDESIRIPEKIWQTLQEDFEKTLKEYHILEKRDSKATHRDFLSVKVYLREETVGVLGYRDYEIILPNGGGTVDLADYVKRERGDYSLKMEVFLPGGEERVEPRAFFINKIRKKNCSRYMDISSFFESRISSRGLLLPVDNHGHLSVLGGTFVFGASQERALYVAQVTFVDSRYDFLFCKRLFHKG